MNNNLISIIVPVYNIEGYLERCVNSILQQTYANIEIILVDNGSKDGSTELVDRLALVDDRIIAMHVDSRGVSYARLEGVKFANGDWIGFVDGDDFIEPDMYERLLDNALKYDAQISHCGYQMVFPSRVDYYYKTGKVIEQDNITGLKDLLMGTFIESGLVNKLYRRELLDKLLLDSQFDISIRINEDLLMNYYLFKYSSKSIYEDFCPYHYMIRKNSAATSKVNENKLRDPLKVRMIIEKDCTNRELIGIVKSEVVKKLITLSTFIYGNNKDLVKPYAKTARKELKKRLGEILKGSLSIKLKISALWVVIWPASYKFVHYTYSKITGLDKKYEVS